LTVPVERAGREGRSRGPVERTGDAPRSRLPAEPVGRGAPAGPPRAARAHGAAVAMPAAVHDGAHGDGPRCDVRRDRGGARGRSSPAAPGVAAGHAAARGVRAAVPGGVADGIGGHGRSGLRSPGPALSRQCSVPVFVPGLRFPALIPERPGAPPCHGGTSGRVNRAVPSHRTGPRCGRRSGGGPCGGRGTAGVRSPRAGRVRRGTSGAGVCRPRWSTTRMNQHTRGCDGHSRTKSVVGGCRAARPGPPLQ
jgi:hypothetical protein